VSRGEDRSRTSHRLIELVNDERVGDAVAIDHWTRDEGSQVCSSDRHSDGGGAGQGGKVAEQVDADEAVDCAGGVEVEVCPDDLAPRR
jgi:hypothetical protein